MRDRSGASPTAPNTHPETSSAAPSPADFAAHRAASHVRPRLSARKLTASHHRDAEKAWGEQ